MRASAPALLRLPTKCRLLVLPCEGLTIFRFSRKPKTHRSSEHSFEAKGSISRYRCPAPYEQANVFGRVSGSLGKLGLRPASFFQEVQDGIPGWRYPIRLKLNSAVSHLRKFSETCLLQDAVCRVSALDLAWHHNIQLRPVGIAPNLMACSTLPVFTPACVS